MQFLTATIHPG